MRNLYLSGMEMSPTQASALWGSPSLLREHVWKLLGCCDLVLPCAAENEMGCRCCTVFVFIRRGRMAVVRVVTPHCADATSHCQLAENTPLSPQLVKPERAVHGLCVFLQ